MKKLAVFLVFILAAIVVAGTLILFARGYRPNFKDKSLVATGIVSVKSKPADAIVFINGQERGKTDIDIQNLEPGTYRVKIVKEGFSAWEKDITVKKEAVNLIEALLFPTSPNLKALTFTGIANPVTSPDGSKIFFAVSQPEKAGIWALNLSSNPLPLFFAKDLVQIVKDTKTTTYSAGKLQISTDGRQLLVELAGPMYFLLEAGQDNTNPKEVTLDIEKILASWREQVQNRQKANLASFSAEGRELAATLVNIQFSPDGTKFFGTNNSGVTVLYDGKPALPSQKPQTYFLPVAERYVWYPDNEHTILINKGVVLISELDGKNNTAIYSGGFEPGFITPWPDGSKLVIATNFNSSLNNLPNLYAIELR